MTTETTFYSTFLRRPDDVPTVHNSQIVLAECDGMGDLLGDVWMESPSRRKSSVVSPPRSFDSSFSSNSSLHSAVFESFYLSKHNFLQSFDFSDCTSVGSLDFSSFHFRSRDVQEFLGLDSSLDLDSESFSFVCSFATALY